MVTGDEKWVTYDNIVCKRSCSKRDEAAQMVAKPGLTTRKVLLCIWWDYKEIIHYELPPSSQTLNSEIYCQQLTHLQEAIDQKRPELANRKGVVLKLRELGWDILMHLPCSPDIAPSDYHLFLSLQNSLGGLKFNSKEDCENHLAEFFANRDKEFYESGIIKLSLKWQQIIEQNGTYLT